MTKETDGELIHYNWVDFSPNFTEQLAQYFEEKELCDFTIGTNDDNFIKAHRMVLSIASSYFRENFKKFPNGDSIYLPYFDPNVLKMVIQFMYSGSLTLPLTKSGEFLKIAKYLRLNGFNETSIDQIHMPIKCSVLVERLDMSKFKIFKMPSKTTNAEQMNGPLNGTNGNGKLSIEKHSNMTNGDALEDDSSSMDSDSILLSQVKHDGAFEFGTDDDGSSSDHCDLQSVSSGSNKSDEHQLIQKSIQ